MIYDNIKKAEFIDRPNRFIANVFLNGKKTVCHVKNTGRCKELLIPGSTVFLDESQNPERKTKYDLISVYKGDMLINIDSQAPNKVFGEWISHKVDFVKPECTHGDSRFDFYLEKDDKKIFAEVKGVTLEQNGIVRFPDAPTLRGIKHINGLCECIKEGYESWIVFVIQMEKCKFFEPNKITHPEFAEALKIAEKQGVKIKALKCSVTPDTLNIAPSPEIPVCL